MQGNESIRAAKTAAEEANGSAAGCSLSRLRGRDGEGASAKIGACMPSPCPSPSRSRVYPTSTIQYGARTPASRGSRGGGDDVARAFAISRAIAFIVALALTGVLTLAPSSAYADFYAGKTIT